MKSQADKFTSEMFDPARGRPPKEHSRSGVERTRDWLQRKNDDVKKAISAASQLAQKSDAISVTVTEKQICNWCGMTHSKCCGICSTGQLGHVEVSHAKKRVLYD